MATMKAQVALKLPARIVGTEWVTVTLENGIYYVEVSEDLLERLAALEARVAALEEA